MKPDSKTLCKKFSKDHEQITHFITTAFSMERQLAFVHMGFSNGESFDAIIDDKYNRWPIIKYSHPNEEASLISWASSGSYHHVDLDATMVPIIYGPVQSDAIFFFDGFGIYVSHYDMTSIGHNFLINSFLETGKLPSFESLKTGDPPSS